MAAVCTLRRMAVQASRRLPGHIIYHCPACFADRVGRYGKGSWHPWPSDNEQVGAYIECTACQAQTSG